MGIITYIYMLVIVDFKDSDKSSDVYLAVWIA